MQLKVILFFCALSFCFVTSQELPEEDALIIDDYEKDDTTCAEGFEYAGGSCFFFRVGSGSYRLPWKQALEYCQNISATLALLKDCNLFKSVVDVILSNSSYILTPGSSYWIGASDEGQEGAWYWIDFSPVELGPPFWGSVNGVPEPSGGIGQNCLTLYADDRYYFHDAQCEPSAYFICQQNPLRKIKNLISSVAL